VKWEIRYTDEVMEWLQSLTHDQQDAVTEEISPVSGRHGIGRRFRSPTPYTAPIWTIYARRA
jgi:hypothetical protein